MWVINNQTPFATERSWVRDKNGAEVWLVAIKGTFLINRDGSIRLAEEQEEVHIAPKFRGAPESTSLLYDTDLPHFKKNTDILIEGHAYAPEGKSVTKLDVSFRVANTKKKVRIIGDRIWKRGLLSISLSRPRPFVKMPIIYERAFGGCDQISEKQKHHGWEARNPIGCGFATKAKHLLGKPAPNIENPSALIKRWKKRPAPAGLGPIAGNWSPRVALAGTYDEKWEKERQPLLAEDFNEMYYQSAPKDQQASGFLKGGEMVEVYNMTPDSVLKFRLPRVTFGISTNFDDNTTEVHRAALHTVTIKPDFPKVVMVWHTHLECHHKVLKLLHTTVKMKKGVLQSEKDKKHNAWLAELSQ